ncbi:MAG: single-stranded DNA-binding protein [Burkholderiaceae bacterium]
MPASSRRPAVPSPEPAGHPAPDPDPDASISAGLIAAARELSDELDTLHFAPPVAHVYNPLDYAWAPHRRYLERFGNGRKRIVFLGMNPGPFGMMQIGVPFGEVAAVRDWMGIVAPVSQPADMHPKRPIEGFACKRSEVSGRRLWGWAAERWGSAERFFAECFVVNYCPLGFLEAGGRNFTPDKLPVSERAALYAFCDRHLATALALLRPEFAIGIGGFARARLQAVVDTMPASGPPPRIGSILHPSPASPAANRGWAELVDAQLQALGALS